MSVSDLKNGLPLAEHWLPLAGVRLAAAENEVERSAFGYVLKVQTTMKAILLNDPENGEKLVRTSSCCRRAAIRGEICSRWRSCAWNWPATTCWP